MPTSGLYNGLWGTGLWGHLFDPFVLAGSPRWAADPPESIPRAQAVANRSTPLPYSSWNRDWGQISVMCESTPTLRQLRLRRLLEPRPTQWAPISLLARRGTPQPLRRAGACWLTNWHMCCSRFVAGGTSRRKTASAHLSRPPRRRLTRT